ncbi:hypothetical protein [Phenylobacterium soli]|uniref:Uncharacterized protein n=1 Tax=Phenylobacterium soli TaxID=2170551 RepID=A0A328AKF4_9CAUL|nr:hypothetical protein [Phenylobacterium soli]RAK54526.1 hypothetical protein DJ017_08330 [Phenylobacterium soli]
MRFKISGYGAALREPLVLYLVAGSIEAACLGGLNMLAQMPECERIQITGPGHVVEIAARVPARATLPA